MSITLEQKERLEYALERLNRLDKELNTLSRWGAIDAIKIVLNNAELKEVELYN